MSRAVTGLSPLPVDSRVSIAPKRRETAADIRKSIEAKTPVEDGMAALHREADRQAKAREKADAR